MDAFSQWVQPGNLNRAPNAAGNEVRDQSVETARQCRLAAARNSRNEHKFALLNAEIDVAHGSFACAVRYRQPLNANHRKGLRADRSL